LKKEHKAQPAKFNNRRVPMKRRGFIKTSIAAGVALAVPDSSTKLAAQPSVPDVSPVDDPVRSSALPWEREIPLVEAAKSVALESRLGAATPQPDYGGGPFTGTAMTVNNLKMRTTIWGPPNRITVSLTKNNVWDRRLNVRSLQAPTLEEITEGAYAAVNKDYVGVQHNSLRPKDYGWLRREGGSHDPHREPMRYPFPSLKPVGQIILGIDALAGAEPPQLTQSCANGVVALHAATGSTRVSLAYVLGMTSNLYAIQGNIAGSHAPIWLRLYRHRDTSHLAYMTADGQQYTQAAAEADKAFNGPMDPPTSGKQGRYFWIRQRMPAEKTFPEGFEYVLMGIVMAPRTIELNTEEGKVGLGTPPPPQQPPPGQTDEDVFIREWKGKPRPAIADAPGAAATATFMPDADGRVEALVAIVTTTDGPDLLAVAKARLEEAAAHGFDGVVQENTVWWNEFYRKRENGRVFRGTSGIGCTEDIRVVYRSYADSHGGGTKTDMRRFECSASYALPERDFQEWDSAPCYNEIFTTSQFVRNRGDSEDMWKQITWHWLPGAQRNAREMFHMPGMLIAHGYLPPVKPDRYVHTTVTLEFCLGTMAGIIRPAWDEWDYGGDMNFLRTECYPLMRELALFYAAYAKKGEDGYYHVIPSMEEERWGFYPKFARNKDVTSSLCMFRWGLTKAADAAELLGVDADLRRHWRDVAAQIAPYPTWKTADGLEFAGQPGLEPTRLSSDHFGEPAMYPALLADEINLDSPQARKDMMFRTVRALRSAGTSGSTLILLGVPDTSADRRRMGDDAEMLLNSRSGRIHLFPVVPQASEVAFRNFQARGGFLVSACKNAEGVYYVEIQARRDIQCQLMNPWPDKQVRLREVGRTDPVPFMLDKSNGECLVFATLAGHRYLIEPVS
jgi:hypothetical protein